MNKIQIIADSISPQGHRLITAIATFPRYLLAEVNTHRMLSRNSASSRAIRFEKMVQSVMENPFIPFKWQKDHAGMQGTEYFTEQEIADLHLVEDHLVARDYAVEMAQRQNKKGVTKQLCNRYLEPFMYHTALISGTELENFFALRAQEAAEIHFQDLAYKWLDAMNESEPKQLRAGEWHIPFGDDMDIDALSKHFDIFKEKQVDAMVKIATVRAARISYATPGSLMKHDYEADLKLHDRLASSGHWSAFEHCAKVMTDAEYKTNFRKEIVAPEYSGYMVDAEFGRCGNFRGFIQYRKMFTDENRSDSRLIKK